MKLCKHKSAIGLCRHRVTLVPNRQRGRMYTRECIRCGLLPMTWPLGDATANDDIPAAEMTLAEHINDICLLWEPGWARNRKIEFAAEVLSSNASMDRHRH